MSLNNDDPVSEGGSARLREDRRLAEQRKNLEPRPYAMDAFAIILKRFTAVFRSLSN
jgi:hypothetical protein